MKILLMAPLASFVDSPPNIPDLGLAYITTSLRKHGYDVHIRDWNMNPSVDDFKRWLIDNHPEVVGIKIFTKDVGAAKKTIFTIKETLHDTAIVIGGPHPSAAEPENLMEDFVGCDFAIKGEAEESLPSLLSEIKRLGVKKAEYPLNGRFKDIPGLIWREGERVFSNPVSFIYDLDKIDFPCWELFNPRNYSVDMFGSTLTGWNTAPIVTTRGCPGKCSFCSAYNVNGRRIRSRSPENVLNEMLLLYKRYDVRKFMFQDNCFTSNKENLIKICEGIINQGMDIEWDFLSFERLNSFTDEVVSLIYRAGGRMIHMGIESGSEKTRKVMNKSCSLKEIAEKIKVFKKNGIKIGAWFMIGFPEETKKEMRETIDYAFSLDADLVTFTICFPLPGSQIYQYIREKYKFDRIDWSNFDIFNSKYPISQLSSKALTRMLKGIRLRIRIGKKIAWFKGLLTGGLK